MAATSEEQIDESRRRGRVDCRDDYLLVGDRLGGRVEGDRIKVMFNLPRAPLPPPNYVGTHARPCYRQSAAP